MKTLHHFIFTPKYRKPMLERIAIAQRCEAHIRHMAELKGLTVVTIAVQPDHVHVFVEQPPTVSVAQVAHWLKWFSSRWLRIDFPELKAYPHLWGKHYFYASVGGNSRTLRRYITDQIRATGGE